MQIKDYQRKDDRDNSDYLLLQSASDNAYYHMLIGTLLSGLSSGSGSAPWQRKVSNYAALVGDRIIADTNTASWVLTLPATPLTGSEVEILPLQSVVNNNLLVEGLQKFESKQIVRLRVVKPFRPIKLVYIDSVVGWVQHSELLAIDYPSIALTYAFSGDANGIFNYIGTNKGVEAWINPYTANRVGIFYSSFLSSQDSIQSLIDRQPSAFHTNSESNPFIGFDLLDNKLLTINYWSYRSRSNSTLYIPNRLILSGSNDKVNYTQIDDKTFAAAQNTWYSFPVVNQTIGYRYFKFTYPASSYFTAGEFELYGSLIWS